MMHTSRNDRGEQGESGKDCANAQQNYDDVVVEEKENSGTWIDHIMYLWGKATADNVIERRKKKHSKAKLENRFRKGIKNMFSFPAASNSRYLSDTRTSHRCKIHSLVNYTTRQFSFETQPLFTSFLMIRSILTEYLNLLLSSSMNWHFIVLKAIVKQLQCSSISDGDSSIANTGPR